LQALEGAADGGRADPWPLGGNEPIPPVGQRGIGVLGDLAPQALQMVFEVALPAARMGLHRATSAAAPPLP
jgi:hypothetical protein